MTGEEMEKAIAFILEQQAQFAVNQQRHEEAMREIEASQAQTAQQVTHLSTAMVEIAEAQTRTADAQTRTADAQTHLAEAQARTETALAETNERMNALINTVERIVTEGRNGKS